MSRPTCDPPHDSTRTIDRTIDPAGLDETAQRTARPRRARRSTRRWGSGRGGCAGTVPAASGSAAASSSRSGCRRCGLNEIAHRATAAAPGRVLVGHPIDEPFAAQHLAYRAPCRPAHRRDRQVSVRAVSPLERSHGNRRRPPATPPRHPFAHSFAPSFGLASATWARPIRKVCSGSSAAGRVAPRASQSARPAKTA